MNFKELYQKLRDGDHISDEELKFLIKIMEPMERALHDMGEIFHHSWRSVWDDVERLKGYRQARKEK